METLFGKPPKLSRVVESRKLSLPSFDSSLATYLPKMKSGFLEETVQRVLKLPSVGSKSFLITIGDRSYVHSGADSSLLIIIFSHKTRFGRKETFLLPGTALQEPAFSLEEDC